MFPVLGKGQFRYPFSGCRFRRVESQYASGFMHGERDDKPKGICCELAKRMS